MKHALYITCYNHTAMLKRLIGSGLLKDVDPAQWQVILFDQSDAPEAQEEYELLATTREAMNFDEEE